VRGVGGVRQKNREQQRRVVVVVGWSGRSGGGRWQVSAVSSELVVATDAHNAM